MDDTFDTAELKAREETLKTLPSLLLPWYDKNKRDLPWRENTDPYRVWVSEIMLQQTRVEAAKEYYIRFLRELPTVFDLAACDEDKLFKLWEGLGYYSRARNMQKAAKLIAGRGAFPSEPEELKKLPGVGEYTAGAVASIAFGKRAPAVDGNVIRVLSRLLGDGRPAQTLKTQFAAELSPAYPVSRCGDFTQSLMELGATVCLPASPRCLACPIFALCKTRSDALPARKSKAQRRKEEVTLFLFRTENKIALCRRKEGVLKGLYGFFTVGARLDETQTANFLQNSGLKNFTIGKSALHKHVFSHVEWHMTARVIDTDTDVRRLQANADTLPEHTDFSDFSAIEYFTGREIDEQISLPSAFRWCMKLF